MVRKLKPAAGGTNNSKDIVKQAQIMQKKMMEIQDMLKDKEVEASVGGGAVVAKVNGQKELIGIKISKDVVDVDDVETLEDLILSAVNEAMRQAEELAEREMSSVTGGLQIPGLI